MQVNKKKFGFKNANIAGKGSLVNQNKCVPDVMISYEKELCIGEYFLLAETHRKSKK